jgi:hypothetical protein
MPTRFNAPAFLPKKPKYLRRGAKKERKSDGSGFLGGDESRFPLYSPTGV